MHNKSMWYLVHFKGMHGPCEDKRYNVLTNCENTLQEWAQAQKRHYKFKDVIAVKKWCATEIVTFHDPVVVL